MILFRNSQGETLHDKDTRQNFTFQQAVMYILLSVEKTERKNLNSKTLKLRMVLYLVAENCVLAKNVKHHTFTIKISIVNQLLPWRKVSL